MSSKKCPLCGNEIEDENEKFCSDCRSLDEQYGAFSKSVFSKPEPPQSESIDSENESPIKNSQEVAPDAPTTPHKKSKKVKIWAIILSVLVLLTITTGGYLFYQYKQQNDREELAFWDNSLKTNTGKAYLDYINRYPNGKYVKEAQDNILRYNDNLRKLWESIKKDGSEDEIISFLNKYRHTPYYNEAAYLLDSTAWVNASKLNTQESYKSYLDRTQRKELNGTYRTLAEEKYTYFAQMEFVGGDEWEHLENTLNLLFQQLSSKSYPNLKSLFAETVKTFYTKKDISPDQIIAAMKAEMTKEDIAAMQIVPDMEQMQAKKDNKGYYIVELTAQKKINYNKEKEKSDVKAHFHIVLDSTLKVVELNELKN